MAFVCSVKDFSFSTAVNNKPELRARFAQIAERVWGVGENSQGIIERLKFILPLSKTVAAFLAMKDEPDLGALYGLRDYDFVFPRVEGESLSFYRPKAGHVFATGAFGILEPTPEQSELVKTSAIDVFLVPALAFDRKLFRLGRGRGFYDRTLAGSPALKIGIGASEQISNADITSEKHDCPMDLVVTEKFFLRRLRAS